MADVITLMNLTICCVHEAMADVIAVLTLTICCGHEAMADVLALMTLTVCCSHEAMADVIALMNSLVDVKGKILVPGVNDAVKPVTPEEKALYDPIEFDMVSSL